HPARELFPAAWQFFSLLRASLSVLAVKMHFYYSPLNTCQCRLRLSKNAKPQAAIKEVQCAAVLNPVHQGPLAFFMGGMQPGNGLYYLVAGIEQGRADTMGSGLEDLVAAFVLFVAGYRPHHNDRQFGELGLAPV